MTPQGFIVVFDDEQGLCLPYAFDVTIDGALEADDCSPVAWFPTRAAARKAIRISTAAAKLAIAQGKPANTDFTETLKYVRIRKLGSKP